MQSIKYPKQKKNHVKRVTVTLEPELIEEIHTLQAKYLLQTNKSCSFSYMLRILLKEAIKQQNHNLSDFAWLDMKV